MHSIMRLSPFEWHLALAVSSHSRFKDQENVASQNMKSSPRAVKSTVSKHSYIHSHLQTSHLNAMKALLQLHNPPAGYCMCRLTQRCCFCSAICCRSNVPRIWIFVKANAPVSMTCDADQEE